MIDPYEWPDYEYDPHTVGRWDMDPVRVPSLTAANLKFLADKINELEQMITAEPTRND